MSTARQHYGAVAVLVACVALTLAAQDASIAPNENLVTDSMPPIPASIAERAARYTEFRTAQIVSAHPTRPELLVLTRFGPTAQVHVVRQPLGARTQLTFFPDRVLDASFEPTSGRYFLFQKDVGGNEWFQYYRYDIDSGQTSLLTDGKSRNIGALFNHQGSRIAYTSTRRNGTASDIWVMDPQDPRSDRMLLSVDSGGWGPSGWSHDGRSLVAFEYISANESYLWRVDAETGTRQPITTRGGDKVAYGDAQFSADDRGLYVTTDSGSEFLRLAYLDLATGQHTFLTTAIPWDVDAFTLSRDGKRLAFAVNDNGASQLYVLDTATRQTRALAGLPVGVITGLMWLAGDRDIAFSLNNARTPTDAYSYSLDRGALTRWTESETGGLRTNVFPEAQLVKWRSFDGREISGFLYMPPATFTGKRPVIVDVHGGPEGQSQPVFVGRNNYFLNEMGVAMIYPNVRGSTGYGKTFLAADNGVRREDSYKDMDALFDWIKQDPRLDGDRILVTGGSYGGHMTLVAATHYSRKIRASVAVVAMSNLVTFLENTESYRRDLRRSEYGDEREPQMRAYQLSVAPMSRIRDLTKPIFIVAGKNDPRVPLSESNQMASAVKANGVPRWYLVANDEGHGFAKRPNQDFQFYATVHFVKTYLLN